MGILQKLRSLTSNTERGPRECGYGNTPGAWDNCTIIVAPDRGVMHDFRVFCSEEHAALDQEEQLL